MYRYLLALVKAGRALVADPDLYVKGTMTLSVETSIRICEVLGLSAKLAKPPRARPGGEVAVRRAIRPDIADGRAQGNQPIQDVTKQ